MADEKQFTRAKRRIDDALDRSREQRNRMIDDLEFSNPANPDQWDRIAKAARSNRPCLVFDQTNQYIAQVVNDARQNKPGIKPIPVDNNADPKVAEALEGIIRHIEYVSRAGIAYDTAAEYAARIGLGGFMVLPKIMRPETNQQEIAIRRIHDPLSMILDPDSTEPDGSDLRWAAIEYTMPREEFEEEWPKAKISGFDASDAPWFSDKTIRVCDYFEVVETESPRKVVTTPDGEEMHLDADEYNSITASTGIAAPITREYKAVERTVRWLKLSGAEVLEESTFPSQYIPVVPVTGYELWVKGKRHLCGMVRRMRDAQQAYNYERTAYIESVALQPSAPYIAAYEAIEGHEDAWRQANTAKAAFLPFNHVDEQGNPIPRPQREQPPVLPTAFVQGGMAALNDIQAAIGMYRANLGAPSNETSGRAITARQREGDTANFHYQDNLNRSIEQLGRIIVDMIPRVYDSARIARLMSSDGSHKFVTINPEQAEAYIKDEQGNVSINPSIGSYDVRIVSGPSYTTLRQEASEGLGNILQANPSLTPIIGPMWAKMQDWPEADKVAKALTAMAPPQVQQILNGEDSEQIPPHAMQMLSEAKQHFDGLMQQLQQCEQALAEAQQAAQDAAGKTAAEHEKNQIEWYKAETQRLAALKPEGVQPEAVAQIVVQLLADMQANSAPMAEPGLEYEPIEHEQQEIHLPTTGDDYQQPGPEYGQQMSEV